MKLFMFARMLLLIGFILSLISISIFTVVLGNFRTASDVKNLLGKANAYQHLSDIIKLQVKTYFPPNITNNFILNGISTKLLDFVITPGLIEQGTGSALHVAYEFAKSPTAIIQEKVVVDTTVYKNQAKQAISEIGLPQILSSNADFLVDVLPSSMTIVDLKKHPNNVFGLIIKTRETFQNAQKILSFSYVLLIISSFFIIIFNLHNLRFMIKEFFIGTFTSGLLIFILCLLLPGILSSNLPEGSALVQVQNNLILDLVKVILSEIQVVSFYYFGFSVIFLLLLLFVHFEKLQRKLDQKLKRAHVPHVSVKIS